MSKNKEKSVNGITNPTKNLQVKKGAFEKHERQLMQLTAVAMISVDIVMAYAILTHNKNLLNSGRIAFMAPRLLGFFTAFSRWKKAPGELVSYSITFLGSGLDAIADFIDKDNKVTGSAIRSVGLALLTSSSVPWIVSACRKPEERKNKITVSAKLISGISSISLFAASLLGNISSNTQTALDFSGRILHLFSYALWGAESRRQKRSDIQAAGLEEKVWDAVNEAKEPVNIVIQQEESLNEVLPDKQIKWTKNIGSDVTKKEFIH